ncbi:glycosyltransferase [Hyunsoonleella rubra]|uniref:Glycosyltransferase n=1 Tax=Hyunsoonleella rubra TaxID=1737062 RepID=A0ABW5TD00_9FLAO
MRIGVVVDNEFENDHRLQKEIRLLITEGHTVSVLCFDFGKAYKTYDSINVKRVKIPKKIKDLLVLLSTRFGLYEWFWEKHISNFIQEFQVDALHVHDLYMAKAGKRGINRSKFTIPLTLDLHENYPAAINSYQWATKGWRKLVVQPKKWYKKEEAYLNYADNLVVLSKSFKENLITRFPSLETTPFFVHPNMPDFESFQSFEKNDLVVDFESETPTLFYFGVVAQRRGIIDILPWIKALLEGGKEFHTLIIGPVDKADKSEFYHLINQPILSKNITYIPWADVKFLPAYLKQITIGLAPFRVNEQHNSGVANKLFQYMYGEIPILATKCKAQKELIESANCGLLYECKQEFETQLSKLLDDKTLRQTLGANGKKKLLKLYELESDKQFLNIYNGHKIDSQNQ